MTDATKNSTTVVRRAVMATLAAALLLTATSVPVATAATALADDNGAATAHEASTSRAAQPIGRIVNNTLYGDTLPAADGAGPTLLSNVIRN